MSQNDFNVANQGFPAFRADMNAAFQALASNSSGASEPGTTYAYQWWYDETNDILKMRNGDNDAWITLAAFDQAADEWEVRTGGVYLGGTGAANLLDDYEEGTFTPVIRGNSSAGSATYSVQTGTYTKVGRTVTFEFAVVWSGHTGTGSIEIGGFPFNAGTQTYYLVQTENISLTAGSISFTSRIAASDNYGLLIQTPTGGGVRALVPMDAAGDIRGLGTYQTS